MATLNWKTPGGTTGSLNLANVVTTNTSQTITGGKTFTSYIETQIAADSNNFRNNVQSTVTNNAGTAKAYHQLRTSISPNNYVRSSLRTYADNSTGAELWVEMDSNGNYRIYHTESANTTYTVNTDMVLTDRAFVGAQGGVSASSLSTNNGYIYFKNGLLIQWANATCTEYYDTFEYRPEFPIMFDVLYHCFAFDLHSGTSISDTARDHSLTWFRNAPQGGELPTYVNWALFTCTYNAGAIYFIAIGRADSI